MSTLFKRRGRRSPPLVVYIAWSACAVCAASACKSDKSTSRAAGSGSASVRASSVGSGAGARRASADKRPLRIGIAIPSYVHAVAWIGADKGYFAGAGIEADIKVMGGSAATMRALIGKSIDVGLAGGDAVVKANRAGAKLVVIGGVVDRFYHRLIGRGAIKRLADLRGKRVGLPFLGGPQDMAVKVALEQGKLTYGKDVRVVSLGKELNRMAALTKGEIDATTSQTPPSRLSKLGFHVLADLPASKARFPYVTVVVRRADLAPKATLLSSALRALCRAITFYKAPRNKAASLAIIAKRIGGSDTKGAVDERYRVSGPSLLSYPPEPSRAAFATVARFVAGKAPGYDQVVDLTLLEKVQAEGSCR